MADLATAEVSLAVDFSDLESDVRAGLEERVKRAARSAQKELDDTTLAAAALGDTIKKSVGVEVGKAAAQVRKAARSSAAELGRVGAAASSAGARIAGAAEDAAASVQRVADAARDAGDTLFDLDDSGVIRLNHAVQAVQTSLFDLDTVELERGNARAQTFAETLRGRLTSAARTAGTALRRAILVSEGGAARSSPLAPILDDLAKVPTAARRSVKGIGDVSAALISLIAAGVAISPALLAGGAGVAAFGAVAVPTITRVIKAQTEMSDAWDSLSRQEKIAAADTAALVDQYRALSRQLAPEVLRVYNGVLANTAALLPRLTPLFNAVTGSLKDANQEIGEGFNSDRAQSFFRFLGAEAGPAVDTVTALLIDLAAAGTSVVTALAPLAGVGLGVVSVLVNLVTAVGDLSPELIQLAVLAVALRSPLSSLGALFGRAGGKAREFAAATKGASLATRGLNLLSAAGPNLYLAAAAGIALFAIKLATARTEAQKLTDTVNANNRAVGNNLEGYREANKVFTSTLAPANARINDSLKQLAANQTAANAAFAQGALVSRGLGATTSAASQALDRNNLAIKNITEGAKELAETYGITEAQARQLADTIGLNLSKGIVENGVVTAATADKVARYQAAVELARNPTLALSTELARAANESLNLTDRVEALSTALNQAAAPALALFAAENRLREVNAQTGELLKKRNVSENERRAALERTIGTITNLATAEFGSKQTVDQASKALRDQLPALERLAGGSKTGRAAITRLREALAEMKRQAAIARGEINDTGNAINNLPKITTIKVRADTLGAQEAIQRVIRDNTGRVVDIELRIGSTRANAGARGGFVDDGVIRRRDGGPLRRAGGGGLLRGPGTGTSDSIPAVIDGGRGGFAALSNREYVINAKQTRRHFGLIEAINRGKFATGGYLGRPRRLAAGGAVRGYATGGRVGRASSRSLVDIGALLGTAIARGLRGTAPAIRKEVDKIRKSLEKKIVSIGQTVGVGFFQRITGSPSEINRAFTQLEKQINRAFTGIRTRVDDLLVKRLERLNERLSTLAKSRDALTKKLEEATRLAATVTERTRAFASLTGFEDDERASAESIANTLRDRLTKIRQFQRDIGTLTRRGLDKGVIQELVEGGPEQSGELARTLARAGASSLREINSLQKRINETSKRFGRDTADALFDAGVAAGKGFLTGLRAERKSIVALMTEIARSVAKTVKDTLKIKSPSVVLRGLAIDTMRGYIDGVRAMAARVRASVAAAVRPDNAVRRAASLEPADGRASTTSAGATAAAAARGVEVTQTNHFHQVVADPAQIIAVTENRLVAALRGA